ncbi:MAG TPA: hypothetical protein P5550_06055, partial [Bacteroidales bacterium]|nr:hypothetical protein [Bacteroidales bacterium]
MKSIIYTVMNANAERATVRTGQGPATRGMQRKVSALLLLMAMGYIFTTGSLQAAIYTSTGSGSWNAAATWGGSGFPVAGDSALIAGGHTITVSGSQACEYIEFTGNGSVITINGGADLVVSNQVRFPGLNTQSRTATITGAGWMRTASVYIGKPTGFLSGIRTTTLVSTIDSMSVTGDVTVEGVGVVGTLNSGYFSIDQGTVRVAGTVVLRTPAGNGLTRPLAFVTMNNGAHTGTLMLGGSPAFNLIGNTFSDFFADSTGNTVEYYGAAQTVWPTPYYNLILSGSGVKTMTNVSLIQGDLTIEGTASATAALAMTIGGDFILETGATFNAQTFKHRIAGDWFHNGGTFTSGTSRFRFNGTATQNIGGTVPTAFNRLMVDNAAGLTLSQNISISDSLRFATGVITTGTDTVKMGVNAKHLGEGATGYVNGYLLWNIPTGASVQKTFFIGNASAYAPVMLDFSGISTGGTLTGSTTGSDHPSIATSGINAGQSVNRYWTLTNAGLVFTDYDAVFHFVAGDLDGGADALAFQANKLNGTVWSGLTTGTLAALSTQVTGVTSFSDFQLGECAIPAVYNVTGGGTYCPGGAGFSLGVDNSDTLVSYQLYLNDTTAVGAPVPGDAGNPISFGAQTDSGTYTVVATHDISGCSDTMSGTAVIALYPATTASVLSGDTCICDGGTASLFVAITGGTSPFTLVLDTGAGDTTIVNYISGSAILLNPDASTTYGLTSVTDANGCSSTGLSGTPVVTIDLFDPVFTFCPADTIVNCTEDTTTANLGFPLAQDSCTGVVSITYADVVTAGSCPKTYTFVRTFTATDVCGNTETCIQNVTVQDTTDPVFTFCPADTTIDCTSDTTTAVLGFASATDNCNPVVSITYSDAVTSGSCPDAYSVIRTWVAVDSCGNSTTCIQNVTVQDTTDPVITFCPADTTIDCSSDTTTAVLGFATATDNCTSVVSITYSDAVTPGSCPDAYSFVRTWVAADSCGNSTTCVQNVTVQDTTDPTFTVPADTTLYRDATCSIDTTTADIGDVTDEADNCSTGLEATYVDDVSGMTGCNNTGS